MVLMAALTTGTDIPDWGRGGGCCGCYGGGYGGCYGYGRVYGWGGYGRGGYGWGGYGYGTGWGGYGWGGYGLGGYGYGGYVLTNPGGYYWGGYGVPNSAIVSAGPLLNSTTTSSMYYSPGSVSDSSRATIRVHLPSDAILYVDGKLTSSASGLRQFVSPPLDPNKDYHYTMKVEATREGKTMTTTRRVDVLAGRTEEVYLNFNNSDETNERVPADSPRRKSNPDQP
jgi:uncharacterized protein (TIGR03000 family)